VTTLDSIAVSTARKQKVQAILEAHGRPIADEDQFTEQEKFYQVLMLNLEKCNDGPELDGAVAAVKAFEQTLEAQTQEGS
jgi:hypothetical protein